MPQRYAIIGYPLGHSLSPVLHQSGFDSMHMSRSYSAMPLHPEEFDRFALDLKNSEIQGLSVTIPYKERIIPFLDSITYQASQIGAVNTVYRQKGKLLGDNTDLPGFMAPLNEHGTSLQNALILGCGGAARAVAFGLAAYKPLIAARSKAKAAPLCAEFNLQFIPWEKRHLANPSILINTTPLGMCGKLEDQNPWPYPLESTHLIYDLIYNPMQTLFIKQAQSEGIHCITGLDMFIHQAMLQFKLWTGKSFTFEQARNWLIPHLKT